MTAAAGARTAEAVMAAAAEAVMAAAGARTAEAVKAAAETRPPGR